jgi:hypothetical protein
MGATDWPTWWVFLAPALMLGLMAVCMTSMRCMMRGSRHRPDAHRGEGAGGDELARTGPHVPARFPDGQATFENLGTAKDKAEFDKFMAERKRPDPPA